MVNKLTNNVKPLDEVDKINEIIDELDNIDPLPSQTGQSGKYLTTNGTVPSWADVQSLPSQTGKAGKFLQTDGTDASWESAPFRNIGEIVASTIPLTDAGLHLLDGSLIQGSGIYSAFVTYIAGLVSTYPNLFVTESDWQTVVSTYGVCGKFVYDSTNNTVRLPKTTGKLDGTTDVSVLGDLEPLMVKLPNITGQFVNAYWADTYTTGAFKGTGNLGSAGGTDNRRITNFDASRSSSVYSGNGTDTTIHEQAINVLLYIVIATSTKTDIEVDIDEVVTDLNGKADVDLSNTTPTILFATAMNTAGIRTVVETYVNGTSWYRVYSDGWCEQGGYKSGVSAANTMEKTSLLKSYINTNYSVQATNAGSAATSYTVKVGSASKNETDGFYIAMSNTGAAAWWCTAGYIS